MTSLLPFLFILICPLMMLFMMRGMHGRRAGETRTPAVFDEHGALRRGLSVHVLADERDRLEEQLVELESAIDVAAGQAREVRDPGAVVEPTR
jgi:hypothetical protein